MKLKCTKQCPKCPWKKGVNPHNIPNGYDVEKHKLLRSTIADPNNVMSSISGKLRIMACHETEASHCVGWLHNQLGVGNNVGLRIAMLDCENIDQLEVTGEQHELFDETFG
jgi:hypothetical protein